MGEWVTGDWYASLVNESITTVVLLMQTPTCLPSPCGLSGEAMDCVWLLLLFLLSNHASVAKAQLLAQVIPCRGCNDDDDNNNNNNNNLEEAVEVAERVLFATTMWRD